MDFTLLSWEEANEKYDLISKSNSRHKYTYPSNTKVVVFDGDAELETIEFNRKKSTFEQFGEYVIAVIVNGNLTVSTDITLTTSEADLAFVLVKGNLKARNVLLRREGILHVDKNADIDYCIYAEDGIEGNIRIEGDFNAEYAYLDRYLAYLGGKVDATVYVNDKSYEYYGDFYDVKVQNEEAKNRLVRIIQDNSDIMCIYTEELEEAMDDEDYDLEEELSKKLVIFKEEINGFGGQEDRLVRGEKIFREMDLDNLK